MCATQLWFSLSAFINHLNVTRTARYRNPFLPSSTTHSPLCPDICQTRHRAHHTRRAVSFFFPLLSTAVRSRLARIISYAFLNKSARTAITIDIACLPPLSLHRSRSFHLFRLRPEARAHTHDHHNSGQDRFVKYEDFNQKGDGIRARISNENYRDTDSEELMIDATAERSTILENELAAIFCVLLCNERTYERTTSQACQCSTAIPSVCATRLATKIDKRPGLYSDRATKKETFKRKEFFSFFCRL